MVDVGMSENGVIHRGTFIRITRWVRGDEPIVDLDPRPCSVFEDAADVADFLSSTEEVVAKCVTFDW
jgi:hypothetical protein